MKSPKERLTSLANTIWSFIVIWTISSISIKTSLSILGILITNKESATLGFYFICLVFTACWAKELFEE